MRNYLVRLAFDGQGFQGTQKQPGKNTLQDEMEGILGRLYGHPIAISCCSRLDRGVSALDFCFSFEAEGTFEPARLAFVLDRLTGDAIRIKSVKEMPLSFSAHHTPHGKTYGYFIDNGWNNPLADRFMYRLAKPVSVEALRTALAVFVGKHDFSSFAALTERGQRNQSFVSEITKIRAVAGHRGKTIKVTIEGWAFYKYQVRIMIGEALTVAYGKKTIEDLKSRLDHPNVDSYKLKAPANGLVLLKVKYRTR